MTDDKEWQTAAEIEQSHPHWMVIWGSYSRQFWAFPRFQVPEGTILSAPTRERLLGGMRDVETEAASSSRMPRRRAPMLAAHQPTRQEPTWPNPERARPRATPVALPAAGASGWVFRSAKTSYDPYAWTPQAPDPADVDFDTRTHYDDAWTPQAPDPADVDFDTRTHYDDDVWTPDDAAHQA